MWCRWAHPHSGHSRSSFIRPSEWPHSSPSPQLVTLCLCRGPRTNFSLFPLPDLPCTTHLSHASLLFKSMWWLQLRGSSLSKPPRTSKKVESAVFVYVKKTLRRRQRHDKRQSMESADISSHWKNVVIQKQQSKMGL